MWFVILLMVTNVIGLTALFAALALGKREAGTSPNWLVSRRGLGILCIVAAGVGLVAGTQFKVLRLVGAYQYWTSDFLSLSLRVVAFLAPALALLAAGVTLLILGGPAGVNPATDRKGPFAWSLAMALVITLAELSIFQEKIMLQDRERILVQEQDVVKRLPRVTVDTKKIVPKDTYNQDYQFDPKSRGYFSRHIASWQKCLEDYKGKPNINYLEVGIFEGQSALWMLENILTDSTSRMTGVDPFLGAYIDGKPYKKVFYSNLELSKFASKATIIEGFSQIELRKLPLDSFDIIYIDGSHHGDDALEDAILAWRLLKDGGTVIFDDYLLYNDLRQALDVFFDFFGDRFELEHVEWQVIAKKKPTGTSADRPIK